jgi:hydrogenase/urease accessory protein HupE
MNKFLIAAATLVASSSAALAHAGDHAYTLLNSIGHVLSEPDHLAMIVVGVVVVGVLFYKRSRRSV